MGIYENIVNKSKKKDEEENVFQRIVDLASSKENIPSKFSTSRTASENYDIQRQAFNIAQKNYNSALQSSYQKNRAFDFSLPDMRENNFLNSSKENRLIFPGTSDGKVNYFDTEENKKRISKSRDETSDLKKVVDVELNDLKYANYLKNAEKVNSEETTLWDKTGGVIGRALTDVVSSLGSDKYKYIDEQGNTVYLPTYGDLKQQKVREDYNSDVGRFLGDVFYNTTKIAGTSALNTVAPGVGTTLYWQDMFLDSYKNSLSEGHDNIKSIAYAIANTGLEYATGKFLGSATKGLTGGKTNELTNALSNVANKITKNPKVASVLGSMGSEATEEFLQEYLDNASRLLILGEDIDLTNSQIFEDALYSAAVGGLSGGLLSSSNRNESDMIKRRVDTYKEFKKALEETKNKTTDVKQLEQIDNLISKTNDYIKNPFINRDLTEQTINLQNQVNNLQSKTNEKALFPKPTYQYQQTDNNKINNLRKSVSQYFDNSVETQNMMNTIEKIVSDKDYNVVFDDTLSNKNGNLVNAQIKSLKNGEIEIKINPKSNRAVEFLVMHEVTHAIETDSMKKLVMDYASKHSDFEQALENLKQTYGTDEVSSEVLADISGQLFGNQEFINNLSTKQPNIFKKIYNAIVSLANKITGNSKESLFIQDLKNKWEEAYKIQNSHLTNAKYSFVGLKGIKNAVKNNNENLFLIDNYKKAKKLSEKTINNETIRKKTGWFKDQKGDWKFEISDENANIKQKLEKGKTYRLGDILEHEDLYELYPKLKNTTVKFKDLETKTENGIKYENRGYFNRITSTITINNKLLQRGNDSVLNTLIHEIQHWIQKKENFTHGTSLAYGKEQYLQNIGEQDARDATQRRKMNYETRASIPPTTSLNNNRVVKQENKWYPFSKEISNVEDNQGIFQENLESNSSRRELGRNSQKQGLNNSSFSLQKNNDILVNSHGEMIDISDLKETSTMKMCHYNRKYSKENIIAYRGESDSTGNNGAFYGLGLYTTLDKKYASRYGTVSIVNNRLLPDNPIKFKTQNDFQIWEQELATELGVRKNKLYSDNYGVEQYIKKLGYDGLMIGSGKDTDLISFKDVAIQYSQNNQTWQNYLEENYPAKGTRTNMQDIRIPTKEDIKRMESENIKFPKAESNKILNPLEISNLTPNSANTTPKLPKVNRNKENDGDSHFAVNIENKVGMLTPEQRQTILSDIEAGHYDTITNKDSLETAFNRLNENGEAETRRWFAKDSENATATDIAEGWILLKQYADNNQSDDMVAVAKKLRDMGTKAGQTVQAFNIMARMTPEGMIKYAQSELSEAYDLMVKNKSKKWVEQHQKDFDLTPQETGAIMDIMKEVSTMEDGYDKRVELAKIQKIMTDKLPPERGAGTKAWMRISMLFNPKTQVRNVAGNAVIAPVNYFSDLFASVVDKMVSSKTGYRTTGVTNVKSYVNGFKKGVYESYNDFKKGINTRNIEGNRFEIGSGKSFNNSTTIGKSLNRVDSLLSFMLDVGDRGFYEASFVNSINNQLVLNNTKEVTQDMIDIATSEALQRTWQDSNGYTKMVMSIRNAMNKLHIKGYGLGDVLIPFAKTPANLTKAIVDYSPVGLVNTLIKGKNLKNAIETGQFTPQMQHQFVQSLGKAVAGTMLYVAGYALAKAGIVSGESDDDKDVRDFMKNTLGVNSYSIKIGNKTFAYDWAQPIAAPLSIMANIVQKDKSDASTLEKIVSSLDTAGNILLEQSFMESINTALNNNNGLVTGIEEAILDLPSRAIPTFMKQIVDLTDSTQRTSFEYDKPIESMVNSIKAKIPGLSKTLTPVVDTMGREVQRYGGKNNIFNVFLNPANVSTENISKSAKEIYRLYKETGNTAIMPRVAPYYLNKSGEKINLTAKQRAEYQKTSGDILDKEIKKLLNSNSYQNMSDAKKKDVIKNIVDYSYNIAQSEVLGVEISQNIQKAYEYSKVGNLSDYYLFKNTVDTTNADTKKNSITTFLLNSKLGDKELAYLYSNYYSSEDELQEIMTLKIPIKEFIKYNSQEFESDYNENTGKAISNSRKQKVIRFVNSLNLSIPQKAILIKKSYNSYDDYNKQIVNYVNNQSLSKYEKASLLKNIGFDEYDSYIINEVNSKKVSRTEKEKILESMGFKIINGKVYY